MLALWLIAQNLAADNLFIPYIAEYQLEKKGVSIARVTTSLSQEQQHWRYASEAKPYGIAALFSDDRIAQHCLVEVKQQSFLPLEYHASHHTDDQATTLDIAYDHQNKTARLKGPEGESSVKLQQPHYDPQCLQLAIMLDLAQARKPAEYQVIEKEGAKRYYYKHLGTEQLQTELGEVATIKLVRTKGSRTTYTWYAPQYHYLPVQIHEYKKDKLNSAMVLRSIKFQ